MEIKVKAYLINYGIAPATKLPVFYHQVKYSGVPLFEIQVKAYLINYGIAPATKPLVFYL